MNTLKILKAGNGDALLLRYKGNDSVFRNIIIDGGNKRSDYEKYLKKEILEIQFRNEFIDLLIITHTDQDHVKGIQYLLNDNDINKAIIKEVWFNSFDNFRMISNNSDISYLESCEIQNLISENNILRKVNIIANDLLEIKYHGITMTILSPYIDDIKKLVDNNASDISSQKNDYSYSITDLINNNTRIFQDHKEDLDNKEENKVSIAFLLEIYGKSILFLGDATPEIIELSIERLLQKRGIAFLNVDFIKLSHHGSHRSISLNMMRLLQCHHYIISTNREKSNLPNKLAFAKILNRLNKNKNKDYFYFNFSDDEVDVDKRLNFLPEDFEKYNFECSSSGYQNGLILEI